MAIRTPEQVFMHECMTLMTYLDMMDHQGFPVGENWVCGWEEYNRVYIQMKRCKEAYKQVFITPEWKPDDHPANDNQA